MFETKKIHRSNSTFSRLVSLVEQRTEKSLRGRGGIPLKKFSQRICMNWKNSPKRKWGWGNLLLLPSPGGATVFVKGKIVSLQAIVPSVGVIICRFSIQNSTYEQLLLSKFQPQLSQIQQYFLMCGFAEFQCFSLTKKRSQEVAWALKLSILYSYIVQERSYC